MSGLRPGGRPVLLLVGATGTGKSDVALSLARTENAEIVSADSRQGYRDLTVGTAKPVGRWERGKDRPVYVVDGVPHHGVDFLPPTETYDAGRFVRDAAAALADIASRGRAAIVAGGTGLYLRALVRGLAPLPPADAEVRRELADRAERLGRAALHAELARIDPASAAAIPANNLQRVLRAIEVHRLTGRPMSAWLRETAPSTPWAYRWVGLRRPPDRGEALRRRCRALWPGLCREAADLLARGVPETAPALESLGYREAVALHRGALAAEEAFERFFRATRQYAKRQATWFRAEKEVRWIDVSGAGPDIAAVRAAWIGD